jgi:hypothetical protein
MAGSLLLLHITEPVCSGKCGKIICCQCEWAFCYQFFAAGALWIEMSYMFLFKLKPFFCKQVPFKFKTNISGLMRMEDKDLLTGTIIDPY